MNNKATGTRITEWFSPEPIIRTQYGTISQRDWAERELQRIQGGTSDFIEIEERSGMISLVRKPRPAQG